jgi:hypothetical protein
MLVVAVVLVIGGVIAGIVVFRSLGPGLFVPGGGNAVPSPPPLSSSFAWSTASNVTASEPTPGCAIGTECYYLGIGTTSGSLTASNLSFGARSARGAALSESGWTFTLLSVAGSPLAATWPGAAACVGASCGEAIAAGETIVLDTGGQSSLFGDNILAIGSFGAVGTVGGLPE